MSFFSRLWHRLHPGFKKTQTGPGFMSKKRKRGYLSEEDKKKNDYFWYVEFYYYRCGWLHALELRGKAITSVTKFRSKL